MQIDKQIVSDNVISGRSYGYGNSCDYIVIHETANYDNGASAQMHARLQSNHNNRSASWHYQVDHKGVIQSFPDNVKCWHAGGDRLMNTKSIGIEICVNYGGEKFRKAVDNAIELTKHLMDKYDIPANNVITHHDASWGKDCPHFLRANSEGVSWNDFKNAISGKDYEPPKRQEKPAKVSNNDSKWNKVSNNWHGQLLQRWNYGGAVRELQKLTSNNNPPFYPNNDAKNNGIDGYYGRNTEDCVRRYQSYYGLTVDGLAGKETYQSLTGNKSKPSKSIRKMAQEVIDGKHGNGHSNRRKSLGISRSKYKKVRRKVNEILSGGGSPRKSINQMADEVIRGIHGSGHSNRRKSLGISKARYAKVRKEVNSRF